MEIDIWQFFVFGVVCAFVGGISGFLIIYGFVLKNKKSCIQLSDDKIFEEIIDLKTSVRLIYIVGPIVALFFASVGIQSLEELTEKLENDVREISVADVEMKHNIIKSEFDEFSKSIAKAKENLQAFQGEVFRLGYVKEVTMDNRINNLESNFDRKIKDYAKDEDVTEKLRRKVSIDDLASELGEYLTLVSYGKKIEAYAKDVDVTKELNNRITSDDLNKELEDYLTKNSFGKKIIGYAKDKDVTNKLNEKLSSDVFNEELKEYLSVVKFNKEISVYVKEAEITKNLKSKVSSVDLTKELVGYLTKNSFSKKIEEYAKDIEVTKNLKNKVSSEVLAEELEGYLTRTSFNKETVGYAIDSEVTDKLKKKIESSDLTGELGGYLTKAEFYKNFPKVSEDTSESSSRSEEITVNGPGL